MLANLNNITLWHALAQETIPCISRATTLRKRALTGACEGVPKLPPNTLYVLDAALAQTVLVVPGLWRLTNLRKRALAVTAERIPKLAPYAFDILDTAVTFTSLIVPREASLAILNQ